ncbi:MAG: 50S ribosomal protein L20 [Acidobacteria bacterium RBG_16_64_8]|nr:MAG: 50S ribosomal protein L20 [Acidobacteria bacterium RBG_16_64_8]
MARVKRSISAHKKRRKTLEEARGYWGLKKSSYRRAKEQLIKSGTYAYRDRRVRKREFRRLWITRINAGAREHGMSYNQLIHGLKEAHIDVDRKILADLVAREPEVFAVIAARAKEALGAS